MIEEGLVITAIGMGVVFIFLGILVLSVKIASILILKYEGRQSKTHEKKTVTEEKMSKEKPVLKTAQAEYLAIAVALAYKKKNT